MRISVLFAKNDTTKRKRNTNVPSTFQTLDMTHVDWSYAQTTAQIPDSKGNNLKTNVTKTIPQATYNHGTRPKIAVNRRTRKLDDNIKFP